MGELGDTVRVVRAAEGDYVESRGARARVQVRSGSGSGLGSGLGLGLGFGDELESGSVGDDRVLLGTDRHLVRARVGAGVELRLRLRLRRR